jgi:2-iminobutanoate/2-iminopropanoate deaminase
MMKRFEPSTRRAGLPLPARWLAEGQEPMLITRIGQLAYTTGVIGLDSQTGALSEDPSEQFAAAFNNLADLLSRVCLSLKDVALLNVHIPSREHRRFINAPWLAHFPGSNRPARKTNQTLLPKGIAVQLQAVASATTNKGSIEVPGLVHRDPLPSGFRAGEFVFSSVITGEDPASGQLCKGRADQIRCAFDNSARLMQAAGASVSGINRVWVFLADMRDASDLVGTWTAIFPADGDRPARKTIPYALPDGVHVQLQITGVTTGRRMNFELPGVAHHDPIPLASRIGPILQSSGIHGIDPATSQLVSGNFDRELQFALSNLKALMERSEVSVEAIALLSVILSDLALAGPVIEGVRRSFAKIDEPLPVRFVYFPLPSPMRVQFHLTALWRTAAGYEV